MNSFIGWGIYGKKQKLRRPSMGHCGTFTVERERHSPGLVIVVYGAFKVEVGAGGALPVPGLYPRRS